MGWWFGRILTFEVVADAVSPSVGAVLNDAGGLAIDCQDPRIVRGYAAYGKSIGQAVEPLVASFGVALFEAGAVLRGPTDLTPRFIAANALGNSADGQSAPLIQREQQPARALPATVRLSYYDPARDYQTAEARAVASEEPGVEQQRELPAVLDSGDTKGLAQAMLARSWAERDTLTLRLAPDQLEIEPGMRLELDLRPRQWTVNKCTIDGLVVVVELRPTNGGMTALAADPGRVLSSSDVVAGEATIAAIDAAMLPGQSPAEPTVLVAASSATAGWRARPVEVRYGGQRIVARTASRKAVLGAADAILAAADPAVMDTVNTIDVTLVDTDQWLVNCTDEALVAGANLALIGKELIQFGRAEPIGLGKFRLSRLMRGVGASQSAIGGHVAGELFVLIERDSLAAIPLPPWATAYPISVVSGVGSAELTLTEPAAIADPSGGATADSEARAAIAQMLSAMRQQGWIGS